MLLSLVKQMFYHGLTGSTVMTCKFAGIIFMLTRHINVHQDLAGALIALCFLQ